MRSTIRELAACDAELRKLSEQLHDHTWDPDEVACVREDVELGGNIRHAGRPWAVRPALDLRLAPKSHRRSSCVWRSSVRMRPCLRTA